MKIDLISDTHGYHRDPFFYDLLDSDADLLIHAGDLSMRGEPHILMDVNRWFGELPHPDKVVIAGNHDITLDGRLKGLDIFTNAIYLQNNGVKIDDFIIWGCPDTGWNHEYIANMFAFGREHGDLKFEGMPNDVDILVTHNPPRGYGDLLGEGSSEPDTHIGSINLLKLIEKYKPSYNITGHIHEAHGVYEYGATKVINASVVNQYYNLVNKPIIITIN